jgi:hypothetical protein
MHGAVQQAGLMRADLTELTCTYALPSYKGRETQPLRLAPMDRTYRDAPGVRRRYSFSRSEVVTPRLAYFLHLEGSFSAGGELAEPSLVQYLP